MSRKHTNHSDKLKFKVALDALKGEKITDLWKEFNLSSAQIYDWKKKLEESGAQIFGTQKKHLVLVKKTLKNYMRLLES